MTMNAKDLYFNKVSYATILGYIVIIIFIVNDCYCDSDYDYYYNY